ncbi:MAG: substrate-binding domain-containing protein [Chloroflexota bacterium]
MSDKLKHQPAKTLSRRDFLRVTGLATSAAVLSACAVQAPQQAAEQSAGDAPANEAVTIAWWNQFSTDTTQQIIPPIVDLYEENNAGVSVEYEISGGPPGGGDYIEVLLSRIAAGNPPDSITLWSPPSQFGARGSLAEIDEFMESAEYAKPDAFFDAPLNSCKWEGKTYGLPASAGAGTIFINKAMFEDAGLSSAREDFPTTWEGLQEISEQLNVWEGDELSRAGIVPWTASWLKTVWSNLNGGNIFDADAGAYALNSDENVEWLTHWVNWLDDQYGGDIETLNLWGAWGGVYPGEAFNLEQSAMAIEGSWGLTDAGLTFDWEVVKFPIGPSGNRSVTGFWPNWFSVPAGAPNPTEAFRFCEHFCTKGWEIWYRAIMDTPAWRDFPEDILTEKLIEEQGEERARDLHNFFAEYLEDGAAMWNSPIEDFASDTIDAAIDEILHTTKSPADALAEAQDLVQSRLEETLNS